MPDQVSERLAREICDTWARARNEPDLSLLDLIYSPDVVVHDCSVPDDLVGLDALKAYYAQTHDGIPDFRCTFDEVAAARDLVVSRFTCSGTHTRPMRGLPPTGRSIRFSGMALDRVADGVIVEEWVYFNVLDLMQQLGFTLTR